MSETLGSNHFSVYAETERPEMLPFIPESAKRVLDVGCSTGNFGASIKQLRGAEVWGVEVDEDAAKVASERLDRVLTTDFANACELPKEYFDCVIFNDVLEHMIDPYSALTRTKELLSAGGTVVASIPNVRYFGNLWSLVIHGDWEYVDSGILDRTHLRFFTKKSIMRMFSELGFRVDLITGINSMKASGSRLGYLFSLCNLLTNRASKDMNWLQFVVVAQPAPLREMNRP